METINLEFLNTPNLSAESIFEYSKEEICEILRCKEDPIYFIEKYCIQSELLGYQKKLINFFHEGKLGIVNSCRQAGNTVLQLGHGLWTALFTNNSAVGFCTTNYRCAEEMRMILDRFYKNIPDKIKPTLRRNNVNLIEYSNFSRIKIGVCYSDFQATNWNLMFMDNFAYHEDDQMFFNATMPAISSSRKNKAFMISNPYKKQGVFWETWTLEKSSWEKFTINWKDNAEHNESWKETMLELLHDEKNLGKSIQQSISRIRLKYLRFL